MENRGLLVRMLLKRWALQIQEMLFATHVFDDDKGVDKIDTLVGNKT